MQTPSAEPSLSVQRTQYTINEVEKEDVTQVVETVAASREFYSSVATPKVLVNRKGARSAEANTTEATSIDKVTTNEETAVLIQNSPASVVKTAESAGNSAIELPYQKSPAEYLSRCLTRPSKIFTMSIQSCWCLISSPSPSSALVIPNLFQVGTAIYGKLCLKIT
uniref:Uncharacterized protein n=1 Tax=Ditylenchus dipsaci TaxID=166011 RepID=A0A915CP26_9BILA